MIRCLLDTSICIDMIRHPAGDLVKRLAACPEDSVGISSVTLAELCYGAVRSANPSRNAQAVAQFVSDLMVVPFDGQAAIGYGQVRAALEAAGTPIGPLDTLIGAQALAMAATLVTRNERQFRRVTGLSVESWRE